MRIEGDYQADGYALVRGLVSNEVASALMQAAGAAVTAGPMRLSGGTDIVERPALEIYGNAMPQLQAFLWGLTPTMETIAGRPLMPTYDFLRIYFEGDRLKVHRDRPACEHSLSLTLHYSDGAGWPLEVGSRGVDGPADGAADDFGDEPLAALSMAVGDAVAYRGVEHRHGRLTPNPNRWSAHLFCHWVDPDGPHAEQAFDGAGPPEPVGFTFGEKPA
jgi:hypothetical protein